MIAAPTFAQAEYLNRCQQLLAQMQNNSIALLYSGNEVTRSQDTEFPFCVDKYFSYLTGFPEPDAWLVLVKADATQRLLFCRNKDPLQEVWHGLRIGQEAAIEGFGFDNAYENAQLEDEMLSLINAKQHIYYLPGSYNEVDNLVAQWQQQLRTTRGKQAALHLTDVRSLLDDMRLVKSASEIALMQRVNNISSKAHERAMQCAAAGVFEYQVEAEILHEFAFNGARFPAYSSIVGGGENATILHYTDNDQVLSDGDLLLIDAGGELNGYAADITRTFPVNGQFTQPQRAIYQLVLDAQNAAIAAIKPGICLAELNHLVNGILTQGLLELGILTGDYEQLMADKACKKFFIHGLGHWLGLDVHDVGDYQVNEQREQQRAFVVGMVMTIEPGLYFAPDDESVEQQWRGIGVRIEDNIVVTANGYHNLTTCVKSIADIEQLMANK